MAFKEAARVASRRVAELRPEEAAAILWVRSLRGNMLKHLRKHQAKFVNSLRYVTFLVKKRIQGNCGSDAPVLCPRKLQEFIAGSMYEARSAFVWNNCFVALLTASVCSQSRWIAHEWMPFTATFSSIPVWKVVGMFAFSNGRKQPSSIMAM